MKKLFIAAIVLCLTGLGVFTLLRAVRAEDTPPYKIASMQAKLFYVDQGTFSDNLIDNPNHQSLWNTIIGEGDAGGSATDVFIMVKFTGAPESYAYRQIHLTATAGKKVILNRTSSTHILNDKGEGYAGFLVYDCTMEPLKLRAEITGQTAKAAIYKVINFESGE